MRIVTNADDFGQDQDTVAATIECLQSGALTSATIMASMPASESAIAFALANPQFSFGVHLTWVREGPDTPERPLSAPADVAALVDVDGRFLHSQEIRRRAVRGRIPVDQIEREAAAQISLLIERGVAVTHVDSHGHLHKFKAFRQALARVLPRFKLTKVRGVQDVYLQPQWRRPNWWLKGLWARRLRGMFCTPDHLFMPGGQHGQWPRPLLERLRGESIEVGVHPGYREAWRNSERLSIQQFAKHASDAGHVLIGWRDL